MEQKLFLLVSKKSAKEALTIIFFADRQMLMSFTAVFPKARHFCNVNLFLMSLIFLFLLLFFMLQNLYFASSAFLLFRKITRRLWSVQSTQTEVPLLTKFSVAVVIQDSLCE